MFSDEAHFYLGGYINKLSHLGHRKTARIHWKTGAPKTNHCLVRILVQRHNQWRSLWGHVKWIFVHKNWSRGYWQHLVSTERRYVPHSRSCTQWFVTCFRKSHYQPQSWCRLFTSELQLAPLDYYLWAAVKDKCYADNPETIDALKDNIREIQLHTINNVLKNWTDRVGYCMASRGSHLNEIIFHY